MYASASRTYSPELRGLARTAACRAATCSSVVRGWAATALGACPLGAGWWFSALNRATPAAKTSARRRIGCGLVRVIESARGARRGARRAPWGHLLWLRGSRVVPRLVALRVRVEPGRGRCHVREARQERFVVLVIGAPERDVVPALFLREQ